jgi:hypothetical protein
MLQIDAVSLGFLSMVGVFLITAELMIRGLFRRLESSHESFSNRMKGVSFRIFNRSGTLWEFIIFMLYLLSGLFLLWGSQINYVDFSILAWLLVFVYFIRIDRVRNKSQWMYLRAKKAMKWEDIEVYRELIETENRNFMNIIANPLMLDVLERASKHAGSTILFDPKTMQKVESKNEIISRLKSHLTFLLSDESSVKYTIEEAYVILFLLSEKARFREYAVDVLSDSVFLDSLRKGASGAPDEI